MSWNRRSALITGGGRGLGRVLGERLASEGWGVGLLARSADQVEEAAGAIADAGGEAQAMIADVLDPDRLARACERQAERFGGIDALICAAGQLRGIGPMMAVDPATWWSDVETALRGVPNAIRAAWPHLRASPLASITVLVGPGHNGELAFASGYGAAQAALVRLVENLAVEFRDQGAVVYAVNPGLVPTPLVQHLLGSDEGRRWLPRITEAFGEGKEVGPEVAAEMVSWLIDQRPLSLSGRVVPALATPELLTLRLDRIASEDLNRLRLS